MPKPEDPLMIFFEALMGKDSGEAIVDSEKRGQQALVNSSELPVKMNYPANAKEILEAWGVKFCEQIDDLFMKVELPYGWKLRATDHQMWSKLLDNKGRERAAIFYKAAFYDRSAHLSLNRRYSFRKNYEDDGYESVSVYDCTTEIWKSESVKPMGTDYICATLNTSVNNWLREHFPNWEDYTAYWD